MWAAADLLEEEEGDAGVEAVFAHTQDEDVDRVKENDDVTKIRLI